MAKVRVYELAKELGVESKTLLNHLKEQGEFVRPALVRATAGYGKVARLEQLSEDLGVPLDHVVYVGDGSSDIHVMLHVNRHDGFTIAVSESTHVAQIAKRTVLSDNALPTLVPILEEIAVPI